jgi:hypothetical protein
LADVPSLAAPPPAPASGPPFASPEPAAEPSFELPEEPHAAAKIVTAMNKAPKTRFFDIDSTSDGNSSKVGGETGTEFMKRRSVQRGAGTQQPVMQ